MLKHFIVRLVLNAASLYIIAAHLLTERFAITGGVRGFVITALIFGILNTFVKPLLKILSFPLVILSAGLFIFVINTFLVWFNQYLLAVLNFEGVRLTINGGWTSYLYAGILMSLANMVVHWLSRK